MIVFEVFDFGAVQECANLVNLKNAATRIFTRKNRLRHFNESSNRLRYSRERALQNLAKFAKKLQNFANFENFANSFTRRRCFEGSVFRCVKERYPSSTPRQRSKCFRSQLDGIGLESCENTTIAS